MRVACAGKVRLVAGPYAGEAAVECSVWANLTAWRSPLWSHGTRLLMVMSSRSRSMRCRCLLRVIVFWTCCKQEEVHHWSCAGSQIGFELRAFFMPNVQRVGNTAGAYTAPHHHWHLPCDREFTHSIRRYLPNRGPTFQSNRDVWCTGARAALRSPGTTREACFFVTPSCLHASWTSTTPSELIATCPRRRSWATAVSSPRTIVSQ